LKTTAIDFLCEIEALQEEAINRTIALLPVANSATVCLSRIADRQYALWRSPESRGLLNVALQAFAENKVERNIAYDPFDIFWGNPDEPKHSWLLWYFVDPHAEHGCGAFLLSRFLTALKISDVELPVDNECKVKREHEHIDLLITREALDGKYAFIIENKVNGAVDQKEQLQTYYRVLKEKRDFEESQIFVCYLTLRGGSPSEDSVGNIKRRLIERTFKDHIVFWLEGVLSDTREWPANMSKGMSDNLKHYLDLIKWLLNREKIIQMNEKILNALQMADKENRLPTLIEITAVKESAQALEECYRRYKRATTISSVQRYLWEHYKLKQTDAYHDANYDKWLETDKWFDDLRSEEYCFGFSIGGIVIVALGEDKRGIYTGYSALNAGKVEEFQEFVKKEKPSLFDGETSENWYSYTYDENVDGTHSDDVGILADKLFQMYRKAESVVAKFNKLPRTSS